MFWIWTEEARALPVWTLRQKVWVFMEVVIGETISVVGFWYTLIAFCHILRYFGLH
jgi:hypothetical protein